MVTTVGYAYPWDVVGDPLAAVRFAQTGVQRIALAAAYHSVRAGTPLHPTRRVVHAEDAALYVAPEAPRWLGVNLVPARATAWAGHANSFCEAAGSLREAGLSVDAWVVLNHSSYVGRQDLNNCVRNAFGEIYPYALCPSSPHVKQYALNVLEEVLSVGRPDGLVLEAVGPLGFSHQDRHDKTFGASYSPLAQRLLSLCFCAWCKQSYAARNMPPNLDLYVRDLLKSESQGVSTEPQILEFPFEEILQVRLESATALYSELSGLIRQFEVERVAVHASPDLWSTGPFLAEATLSPLTDAKATPGTVLNPIRVLPCWGGVTSATNQLSDLRHVQQGPSSTGAYVLALSQEPIDSRQLTSDWQAICQAGFDELHIYHLGLTSPANLESISSSLHALR